MFSHIERPTETPPAPAKVLSDFGPLYAASGFIGWLFAVTAPVAIILAVGSGGGLSEGEIASWIFGVFFFNGLITILFSWRYRQPLVFFWTIPGTVLVGQSLTHLSFPQIVGTFYATGLLMFVLGSTGSVKRVMELVPLPIVMGMVAGVFLRFGLDLVHAVFSDIGIAGPMVAVWLLLSALPSLGRRCPPIIAALVVGAIATMVLGRFDAAGAAAAGTDQACVSTARLVARGDGRACGAARDHRAGRAERPGHRRAQGGRPRAADQRGGGRLRRRSRPSPRIVGGISTCLTGPTNAILVGSGERKRQYVAGIVVGCLAILFGLLAPTFTRLLLNAPKSLIAALAGLAMLRVLQTAFVTAFGSRFSLGALVAFLVTVADHPLLNVGAAFWGLICGLAISFLMERGDFTTKPKS